VVEALQQEYGLEAQIKWPNDVLLAEAQNLRHPVRRTGGRNLRQSSWGSV
jgi:biotin-(acetyl-CoA carboxylase) ligase